MYCNYLHFYPIGKIYENLTYHSVFIYLRFAPVDNLYIFQNPLKKHFSNRNKSITWKRNICSTLKSPYLKKVQ